MAFGLANCLKKPFWTFTPLSLSSSDCSVTASRVRFLFWLESAVAPGAGGGGVDDLVLAVFLLLGVSFSPSKVL